MTTKQANLFRLLTVVIYLDTAIILTVINSKISAIVVVLLISAAICARMRINTDL